MPFSDRTQGRLPPGFPLAATDSAGRPIDQGTRVRIPCLPDWLIHDLPEPEVAELRRFEGRSLPVLRIDAYGYLWFGENSPRFCLRPAEVLVEFIDSNGPG